MKKILTNNIVENVRRQPFNKASLEHIQEAFQEVFADLLKGLTDNAAGVVVLHGCIDSDPDANDYDISAGAVLYNGEVFQVDAFTGSDATDVPVLTLVETYRTGDPVKFSDNNDYNVHVVRKLAWSMAAAGSGIADFDEVVRFKDTIKPNSVKAGDVEFKVAIFSLGSWDMTVLDLKQVDTGIEFLNRKIRGVDIVVYPDPGVDEPVPNGQIGSTLDVNFAWSINSPINTQIIQISRSAAFDNANFNDTTINRGYVTIWYDPNYTP